MNSRILKLVVVLALGLAGSQVAATETEGADQEQKSGEVSPALQKSMDPRVWTRLMNSMMNGELRGQPATASCVECHTDEDVARFQTEFGGMMHAMNPMMQMVNPQGFAGYANGMMAPMTAMINPMTGMVTPMMGMANPMMGMMANPMTGMMANPMTGMMMNPMTGMMMNPMTGMMMNPMNGMMPGMQPPGAGSPPPSGGQPIPGMPQMPQMPHMGGNAMAPRGMMNPEQYEQYYKQWSEMMSNMMQQQKSGTGDAGTE